MTNKFNFHAQKTNLKKIEIWLITQIMKFRNKMPKSCMYFTLNVNLPNKMNGDMCQSKHGMDLKIPNKNMKMVNKQIRETERTCAANKTGEGKKWKRKKNSKGLNLYEWRWKTRLRKWAESGASNKTEPKKGKEVFLPSLPPLKHRLPTVRTDYINKLVIKKDTTPLFNFLELNNNLVSQYCKFITYSY